MQLSTIKAWQKNSFWLSLLGHSLFFISFFSFIHWKPDSAPKPAQYISSYAYSLPFTPVAQVTQEKRAEKNAQRNKSAIEKKSPSFSRAPAPVDMTNPMDREPMRLIGESKIVQPLVKILARAISPHLYYPRMAAEFNLRGVVLVGFVLHPEGYITGTRIVQSSGTGVLDDAARLGVASVTSVGNVSEYVGKPEFLVIGVIFG